MRERHCSPRSPTLQPKIHPLAHTVDPLLHLDRKAQQTNVFLRRDGHAITAATAQAVVQNGGLQAFLQLDRRSVRPVCFGVRLRAARAPLRAVIVRRRERQNRS
jgi:hypothetical protein